MTGRELVEQICGPHKDNVILDHEFTIAAHGDYPEAVWHTTEPALDTGGRGPDPDWEFDSDDEIDTGDIIGAIQEAVNLDPWQTAQVRITVEIVAPASGPNLAGNDRGEYQPEDDPARIEGMEARNG